MALLSFRKVNENEPATVQVLREMRGPVLVVGLFSMLISILVLAQPLYMMNLFDRVLTSLSVDTLIALTVITIGLMISLGFLEAIRARALVRMSVRFDDVVGEKVFDALLQTNLAQRVGGATMKQVDQIRSFLTGHGLIAFFDLPFVPVYLLVLFLLHPALGSLALICSIIVVLLGMSIEWVCKRPMLDSAKEERRASVFADNSLRNAEVVAALGMIGNLRRRWLADHNAAVDNHLKVADTMAAINGAIKAAIMIVQIGILALACYLVILEEATPGTLFAANVLAMRIIAPVQQAVTAWRSFLSAREAYRNLGDLLTTIPDDDEDRIQLPKPSGALVVEKLTAGAPKSPEPILKGISFALKPGQALGVIGPSGSGKSTLGRLLIGVWQPLAGGVRLDGADVHSWDFDDLGPSLGYLPQDVELFDGTIAENIARFGERDDAAIIAAAQAVGLHELILRQPKGYDTEIRAKGGVLSGGQRQRLGLARAVYGDPRLIVLDEPNSNLDSDGEAALMQTIEHLKAAGKTIVVIAHNPRILKNMDKILMLRDGKMAAFGSRQEVFSKLKVVSSAAAAAAAESSSETDANAAQAAEAGAE
ncbi:MAG: type I secretion system permease/ATPase [Rhodospirillales bacterium]|nr:type I secretion system permease/ATPase [Rhodospirillales bacterium]